MAEIDWQKVEEGDKTEIEIAVKQYIKYCYQIAHRWNRTCDEFEQDEAIGIAEEGLMKCLRSGYYNPEQGDFIPYLHSYIENEFKTILRDRQTVKRGGNHLPPLSMEMELFDDTGRNVELKDTIESNSFDPLESCLEVEREEEIKLIIQTGLNEGLIDSQALECYLCWLEGEPQIVLADRMETSQPQISRMISKVKNQLQDTKEFLRNRKED